MLNVFTKTTTAELVQSFGRMI